MAPRALRALTRAAERTPVVADGMLRHLFHNRPTTAPDLLQRADAPKDLLQLAADSKDEDLRAAVLSRPVSDARVRETRAAVLARGLDTTSPSEQTIADALEVFTAKPTRTLATALARLHRPGSHRTQPRPSWSSFPTICPGQSPPPTSHASQRA